VGNSRSVQQSDSSGSVATDGIEAVKVDLFANAAVEVHDLKRQRGRAEDHILESTEAEVLDLTVHGHDVRVAVLVDGLADHVAGVVFRVCLHPGSSESLMQRVSTVLQ
jgi:hypothetical protein